MASSLQQFKSNQKRNSTIRINSKTYPKELIIVAEGDSWFDYPLKKDIIDYLRQKGYAIQNFAKAGDTLDNMVYGSDYKKKGDIVTHLGPLSLQKTLNAVKKLKPRFVLFSAGGNDIVGSEIKGYLNHRNSKPAELINKPIFKAKLERMSIAISFFLEAVHKKNKNADILMDGYDYAKVNGKGYTFIFKNLLGPWILPSMGAKGITANKDQKAILKYLVDEFNEMLAKLDKKYDFFHHIDLRNKFPKDSQWDNEIHLKNSGYKTISEIYHSKMKEILNMDPLIAHQDKLIAVH